MTMPCEHTPVQHEAHGESEHEKMRAGFTDWLAREISNKTARWPLILEMVTESFAHLDGDPPEDSPLHKWAQVLDGQDMYCVQQACANELIQHPCLAHKVVAALTMQGWSMLGAILARLLVNVPLTSGEYELLHRIADTYTDGEKLSLVNVLAASLQMEGFTAQTVRALIPPCAVDGG